MTIDALFPTYLKSQKNESVGDYSYELAINKEYFSAKDDFWVYLSYKYEKML